jgi:MFS family permease
LIGTGVVFYLFDIGAAAGLQRETTSRVFLTFAISMLGAQLLAGPLADRYRLNVLLCIAVALLAVGTTTLLGLREFWHFQLFGLLFGSGQGLALVVGATVWVRYFGPRHLGKIRGTAWSIAVAGSGAGPFILGAVRDRTGSFFGGIVGFALTLAVLAVASLFAVSPQRSSKPRTGADAA